MKGTDYDNLDLVPADFSYRNLDLLLDDAKKPLTRLGKLLAPHEVDDYDIVVLDCPPSISLASEAVFRAADALLVPVIPTTLSARTFDQLDRFVADATPTCEGPEVPGSSPWSTPAQPAPRAHGGRPARAPRDADHPHPVGQPRWSAWACTARR